MRPRRQAAPLARDAALLRLRRLTLVATAAGTALAGAFAALAANAVPGRKVGSAPTPAVTRTGGGGSLRLQPARPRRTTAPAAAASDDAPAPAASPTPPPPAPPPAAPAPTPAPPVVVSGGS